VEDLGSGNTLFIGWNASTEKGPNVPFTQMYTLMNETQTATTITQAIQYASQLDTLYNQYGPTIQLFQIANTVGFASNVHGVVWNSVTDQGIPTYLST
jgi:hypothetical protein